MIDEAYRKSYEAVFRKILGESPRGYYDEAALPSYTHDNTLMSWLFWKRIDTALSMMEDPKDKTVLDFGCGGGVVFRYLSERNCRLTGCDNFAYDLARRICEEFGIEAEIYKDVFEIRNRKFDSILALDVLEHIEDIGPHIDKLLELSHDKTEIIISGPTENIFYKAGRFLAGFSGHYHLRNIYDIEETFRKKLLRPRATKTLYFPIPLFRVSAWQV